MSCTGACVLEEKYEGKSGKMCDDCVAFCSSAGLVEALKEATKKGEHYRERKSSDKLEGKDGDKNLEEKKIAKRPGEKLADKKKRADKKLVNDKLVELIAPLIKDKRDEDPRGLLLDGPSLGTSSRWIKNLGFLPANISIPNAFTDLREILNKGKFKEWSAIQTEMILLYECLMKTDPGLTATFLDYTGSMNGNSFQRPILDIDTFFRRQLPCSPRFPKSLLAITVCDRNSRDKHTGSQRFGALVKIVTNLARKYGYEADLEWTYSYHVSMYVCVFHIRSNKYLEVKYLPLVDAVDRKEKIVGATKEEQKPTRRSKRVREIMERTILGGSRDIAETTTASTNSLGRKRKRQFCNK